MPTFRNAEGVRYQKQVGNPCSSSCHEYPSKNWAWRIHHYWTLLFVKWQAAHVNAAPHCWLQAAYRIHWIVTMPARLLRRGPFKAVTNKACNWEEKNRAFQAAGARWSVSGKLHRHPSGR